MSTLLTFQDAVLRLNTYWAERGCLLWQPANTEVGAGTMNAATFLRVLGPEPWRVGYIEPSVRPDDSRYGDNPNRVQMHTQYQLILKPDPGNPQELYLQSLEALGIDPRRHDIRFVEDNWESPALGAWGLGWEVWLDGLEITQFTYFQQAGGISLDPVSVEVTYGLERILMALQGVDHFKKLVYAPGITYGEVLAQNEYEMSVYNLDMADTERVTRLFELYEAEARMLLDKRLPIPAYSYVLKTSHAFNLLDARGAIGVTERARFFARMRDLARKVALLWLERREELGLPLGKEVPPAVAAGPMPSWPDQRKQTLVLEIGSEELPPADVATALEQLQKYVPEMLAGLRLSHGKIELAGTPRRLAVVVHELAARQPDEEQLVKGPRAQQAYDARGQPTKALLGFAQSRKLDLSAIQRQMIDGTEYVVARLRTAGKPAGTVLAEALPGLIAKLSFPKAMRWNWTNTAYSRPLRWLVALLGDQVMPFTYAGLASGRVSRGLRNSSVPSFEVPNAASYFRLLEENRIVIGPPERRQKIWSRAEELARRAGGRIPPSVQPDLLDEVVNLVESPTPLRGGFEARYLQLPSEVLTTVMRKHQRYFPIEDAKGDLIPAFVAVANGPVDIEAVRAGNEAVIRARYADAEFFWKQDTARPLESFRPALAGLTFQEKLGSMLEKNERLERLAPQLERSFGLDDAERAVAARAAHLAKADLVTQMVIEFTSLAGVMGREYAQRSGESVPVAQAVFEHVLPRSANDRLPASKAGMLLAVADRLDSLVGLFAVGLAPKASADPFAQRRAALGLVMIVAESQVDLDLRSAIHAAAAVQLMAVSAEVEQQVLDFIQRRFEQALLERGVRHDLIQAVLAVRGHNPAAARRTLDELAEVVASERFARVLTAYSRPARIVRGKGAGTEVDTGLFEASQETDLWRAYQAVALRLSPSSSIQDFLNAFEPLVAPINAFFDKVFVMVDNERVKNNRMALLQRIASLTDGIVDLTKVEGF
jgi:glycyl-tRNA synthetase